MQGPAQLVLPVLLQQLLGSLHQGLRATGHMGREVGVDQRPNPTGVRVQACLYPEKRKGEVGVDQRSDASAGLSLS